MAPQAQPPDSFCGMVVFPYSGVKERREELADNSPETLCAIDRDPGLDDSERRRARLGKAAELVKSLECFGRQFDRQRLGWHLLCHWCGLTQTRTA